MKRLILIFFLIFGASLSGVYAQTEGTSATKAQKTAKKKKEQQFKNSAKAQKEGRKKHEALQTKEVRKRMKKNRHRYQHVDSFDNRPNFIQRIFHRKPPAGSGG